MRTHPHAEAVYRVLTLDDGAFGVEVNIPDSSPTTVSKFETEKDAEAWIATHRERVLAYNQGGHGFRGSPRGGRRAG